MKLSGQKQQWSVNGKGSSQAVEAKTADLGVNKKIECFQLIMAGQTCQTSRTQI